MNLRGPAIAFVMTLAAASAGYSQGTSDVAVAAEIRTLRDAAAANPTDATFL